MSVCESLQIDAIADPVLQQALQVSIDQKTKPIGALGRLETLAMQIGLIQRTITPSLHKPMVAVFAGDHGVTAENVSAYPSEVTAQMVLNFLGGGAAINVFARLNDIELKVVDAGVDFEFEPATNLVNAKIDFGTRNFARQAAMTREQVERALQTGRSLVHEWHNNGCNVIGFGEMGIGNTSCASVLTCLLADVPLASCVGAGAGLEPAGIQHKQQVLAAAIERAGLTAPQARLDPMETLRQFAGFEIVMMSGAMLGAAEKRMLILVDGFIATTAYLAATALNGVVNDYCVFAHRSAEPGHSFALGALQATPLLDLQMRLGEGTGAALAFPLVSAAVTFLTQMSSFSDASVSGRK